MEPGLLFDPRHCRQAVVMLMHIRIEHSSRTKCAARALDHYLIAALGNEPTEQKAKESGTPIRAAYQNRGSIVSIRAWSVAVGKQCYAVRHGYRKIALDEHIRC